MPSTVSRLFSDLNSLIQRLGELVQELPIKRLERNGDGVNIILPEFYWGEPSNEQRNIQIAIKRDYEEWFEVFRSVFAKAPEDLNRNIQRADQQLRKWIELRSNWSIQPDPASSRKNLEADAGQFLEILEIIEASGPMSPILIPDTNAIVSNPSPTQYRPIAGNGNFVFLLLPTVLAELDALKNTHRNPVFREKVNKVITRVKGWRNQGTLRNGVTVDRTITVRAIAIEPSMKDTLKWLDKENRDDRIIASVLEVQSSYPNARVVLITGDVNLLNKADFARIDTSDLVGG